MRCDGGATCSPPRLAPVLAHPVPFACSEGDQEHRNAGLKARRCCRAREEEGQRPAAGSVLQRAGCKASAGSRAVVVLVDAIKGSFRKAVWSFWGFHSSDLGTASAKLLGQRRRGLAKGIDWPCLPYVEMATLCQSRCWLGRAGRQQVDELRRVSLLPG